MSDGVRRLRVEDFVCQQRNCRLHYSIKGLESTGFHEAESFDHGGNIEPDQPLLDGERSAFQSFCPEVVDTKPSSLPPKAQADYKKPKALPMPSGNIRADLHNDPE